MKDKLFTKKTFPFILGITALLIAMCAAFFSVYGISTLFAGAFISAVVMASSLEIGKLVGVTFLYRYWGKCKMLLRVYLVTASVVLMIITSLGIFGYLSSAYQKSSIEFAVTQEKIKITEQQIAFSQQSIDTLITLRNSQNTNQMNDRILSSPLVFKQFQQQIADTDSNIEKESKKKQSLIDNVNEMKLGAAGKKDVQTFKFVADAFGMTLDSVARWFIISIIFVFDPLAICLILAYNVAVYRKEDESVYDRPKVPAPPTEEKTKVLLNEIVPTQSIEEPKPIVNPSQETMEKAEEHHHTEEDKSNHANSFFRNYFKL